MNMFAMLVGKPAKNQNQSKYYGTTKCNFEPLKTGVYINQWVTKQRIQEKALLRGTYVKDRLGLAVLPIAVLAWLGCFIPELSNHLSLWPLCRLHIKLFII